MAAAPSLLPHAPAVRPESAATDPPPGSRPGSSPTAGQRGPSSSSASAVFDARNAIAFLDRRFRAAQLGRDAVTADAGAQRERGVVAAATAARAERHASHAASAQRGLDSLRLMLEGSLAALGPEATAAATALVRECSGHCTAAATEHAAVAAALAADAEALAAVAARQRAEIAALGDVQTSLQRALGATIRERDDFGRVLERAAVYVRAVIAERVAWRRRFGLNPAGLDFAATLAPLALPLSGIVDTATTTTPATPATTTTTKGGAHTAAEASAEEALAALAVPPRLAQIGDDASTAAARFFAQRQLRAPRPPGPTGGPAAVCMAPAEELALLADLTARDEGAAGALAGAVNRASAAAALERDRRRALAGKAVTAVRVHAAGMRRLCAAMADAVRGAAAAVAAESAAGVAAIAAVAAAVASGDASPIGGASPRAGFARRSTLGSVLAANSGVFGAGLSGGAFSGSASASGGQTPRAAWLAPDGGRRVSGGSAAGSRTPDDGTGGGAALTPLPGLFALHAPQPLPQAQRRRSRAASHFLSAATTAVAAVSIAGGAVASPVSAAPAGSPSPFLGVEVPPQRGRTPGSPTLALPSLPQPPLPQPPPQAHGRTTSVDGVEAGFSGSGSVASAPAPAPEVALPREHGASTAVSAVVVAASSSSGAATARPAPPPPPPPLQDAPTAAAVSLSAFPLLPCLETAFAAPAPRFHSRSAARQRSAETLERKIAAAVALAERLTAGVGRLAEAASETAAMRCDGAHVEPALPSPRAPRVVVSRPKGMRKPPSLFASWMDDRLSSM